MAMSLGFRRVWSVTILTACVCFASLERFPSIALAENCRLTPDVSNSVRKWITAAPLPASSVGKQKCSRDSSRQFAVAVRLQDEQCDSLTVNTPPLLALEFGIAHSTNSASGTKHDGTVDVLCTEWLGDHDLEKQDDYFILKFDMALLSQVKSEGKGTIHLWLTFSFLNDAGNKSITPSAGVFLPWNFKTRQLDFGEHVAAGPSDSVARCGPGAADDLDGMCVVDVTVDRDRLLSGVASVTVIGDSSLTRSLHHFRGAAAADQAPACSPHCMGDAACQCVDNGVCSCSAGFTGPLCDVPVAQAGTCSPSVDRNTPAAPLGGNYPVNVRRRHPLCAADARRHSAVRLQLSLQVVRGSDCQPVASERVDVWQADSQGVYCPSCATSERTDGAGELAVDSVQPAGSNGRPMVVHVRVHNSTSPGCSPLTTQLYFMGDPLRAPGRDKCGAACRADDPRLSMLCVHWGGLQLLKCRATLVLGEASEEMWRRV